MSNAVVQWQMVSPDPDQSATFYGRLFGWTTAQHNAMGYRVVQTGSGKGIDGGIWPAPPQTPGFVQLFVEVADVEACVTKAVGLGATVVIPTSHLPDGDTMAVLRDPCGITVGVCCARNRSIAPRAETDLGSR